MELLKLTDNCFYIYIKGVETLHLGMSFQAGSRFEPIGANGLAHLTEHMVITSDQKKDI